MSTEKHDDKQQNVFYGLGLAERSETMEAIYRAGHLRDEAAVIRMLDEHREKYGEPEQVAYANRPEHRQDDAELGQFPFETGVHYEDRVAFDAITKSWSPSNMAGEHLLPKAEESGVVIKNRNTRSL